MLYNELSAYERGQLHLRAGHGLSSRRASGYAVSDAELAHHFLDTQPFGDIEVAIAHAQTAANEAQPLAANATLRRALDLLLRSNPKHFEEIASAL